MKKQIPFAKRIFHEFSIRNHEIPNNHKQYFLNHLENLKKGNKSMSKNLQTQEYLFKRSFYYKLEEAIDKTNFCFLLGPRKCGKTVSLLQLEKNQNTAEYYNFKTMSTEESLQLFDDIKDAMSEDLDKIFLLDEITYAYLPEREINALAIQLSEKPCYKTKVVFTGSQSVALEAWANRAFCGNAALIRADFLNYSEWLSYKGIEESTEEIYSQFLYEIDEFYGFISIEDYLKGCLEETIISNTKTDNVIWGNDSYLVDVDTLLDICYTTLFTLHNHVTSHGFSKNDKLGDSIRFYFRDVCKQLGSNEIGDRILASFIGKYNDFRTKDLNTLKQAFVFLYKAGLITITPVSDSVEHIPNLYMDLMSTDSRINYKDELFKSYNVCIKYPMFYIGILKDILGNELPDKLPIALLGSIVECHLRGILPHKGSFEFKDAFGHEVDYVNVSDCVALEITVSNKRSNEMNFKYLPEDYKNIILTKDFSESNENNLHIPYHEFIKNISDTKSGKKAF